MCEAVFSFLRAATIGFNKLGRSGRDQSLLRNGFNACMFSLLLPRYHKGLIYLTQQRVNLTMQAIKKARHCANSAGHETQEYLSLMSASQSITIHRTYQMKGYVRKKDFACIREVLGICQRLYNRALAERKAVYRMTGKSITRFNQFKWLTSLRGESQELRDIAVSVQRGVLTRLNNAYQAFFRRVAEGEGYGFPRFKPWQRYTCIELAGVHPGMVKRNRLRVKGLPDIRIKSERTLPDSAQLKSVRIVLHGRILSVDLTYKENVQPLPENDNVGGIDMGVNQRLTLSTGEAIERREPNVKRQRVLQRAIARKKRGGKNRQKAVAKYARFMRKETIRNRNECHRITTDLVRRFGRIAIEDLKIDNMTRKGGSYKRGLNREVRGQSWGIIRQQLAYKVEWTGRQLTMVNPAYTSRICSECGETQPKPREYRLFECSDCGHTEDRDVNAAKNIVQRGWGMANASRAGHNVEVVNSCVP